MGGKDSEGSRTDSIELYICQHDRWISEPLSFDGQCELKMRKPRSGFAAV